MIKSLLAAAALAVGLAGVSATAEAKTMHKAMHHAKPHVAMCYHTVKGKKHWHPCKTKPAPHAAEHHMKKKEMKKM